MEIEGVNKSQDTLKRHQEVRERASQITTAVMQ
jgi:hypothetical protein